LRGVSPFIDNVTNVSSWLVWALLSACFAAPTAVFAKVGVERIDPVSRPERRGYVISVRCTWVTRRVAPIDKLSVILVAVKL